MAPSQALRIGDRVSVHRFNLGASVPPVRKQRKKTDIRFYSKKSKSTCCHIPETRKSKLQFANSATHLIFQNIDAAVAAGAKQ